MVFSLQGVDLFSTHRAHTPNINSNSYMHFNLTQKATKQSNQSDTDDNFMLTYLKCFVGEVGGRMIPKPYQTFLTDCAS